MTDAPAPLAFLEKELQRMNRLLVSILRAEQLKLLGPEPVKTLWHDNQSCRFFIPDALDDRIQSLLLQTGRFFEEPLLRRIGTYIEPGSTVIDVGANIGNHSLYFALICGAARVHAFEPQARAVALIERNKALNGIGDDQIVIHNHGCGAVTGRLKIVHQSAGNIGAMRFEYADTGGFEVRRLDDCGIKRADFIKIDAERMGDEVLKGAAGLLKAFSPKICIELYEGEDERANKILESYGYAHVEALTGHDYLFSKTPF